MYGKLIATNNTKLLVKTFGNNIEFINGNFDGNRISNDATIWSGSQTGTGSQQTLVHGLPVTPTILELQNVDNDANPIITMAPDSTNIYITATNGLNYRWRVLV